MDLTRREALKLGLSAGVAAIGVSVAEPALAHEGEREEHAGDDHGRSTRLRRWAMVIDLTKCDGCTSAGVPPQCTQYCNWGRVVPEPQQWVEVEETPESPFEGAPMSFFPLLCQQCQNAPCTNVCPVGATFHTPEGVVLIDQERCIGCRLCMAACPYDRRFFNWEEPVQPDWVKQVPYDIQSQVPAMRGTVMKCDFCSDRAAAGGLPMCVEGCPQGALYFGDLEEDIGTNGTEMIQMSTFIEQHHATRYKEDLGTEPRVYYITGHGEDSIAPEEPEEEEAGKEHEGEEEPVRFLKNRLEWPWRQINRAAAAGIKERVHD